MNAAAKPSSATLLRIGDWVVDAGANRLRHLDGTERLLRHKAMALLLLLAEQPGQTVSRELIEERIWDGNTFVAPKAINTAIWAIRQALGDDPEAPRYLETIAKKGYRLIAEVEQLPAPAMPAVARGSRRRRWPLGIVLLLAVLTSIGLWLAQRPAPVVAVGTPEPLTQYPGVEFAGAISPDGQLLAFAWWQGQGDADLYVRPLTESQTPPRAVGGAKGDVTGLAWSADSQSLLSIARAPDGSCTLWRIDLREARQQALSPCLSLFTPALAWSDDGRTIAFTGQEDGKAGLFLIRPDGSGRRRLTTADNPQLPDHQPTFSPDGSRLAFVRADRSTGIRELYEIELPDGQPQRISEIKLRSLHGLAYAPEGDDLILSTTRQDTRQLLRWQRRSGQLLPLGLEGSAPQRGRHGELVYALLRSHVGLAHIELDTARPSLQRLAPALASRRLPALDHQGRQIAFVSRDASHSQLWVQQGDAPARALLRLPGEIGRPAWSGDGRQLAFLASCGARQQLALCTLQADGRGLRAVLQADAGTGAPTWQGDQLLLVRSDPQGAARPWRVDPVSAQAQPWTAAPATRPGARLAWQAGWLFLPEPQTEAVLAWQPASGKLQRWPLPADDAGPRLVTWAAHPEGLLLLLRGSDERLRLLPHGGGAARELAQFPLGSFPERATMQASSDGRRLAIELSEAAHGDLMRIQGAGAGP